jgi:hypothetical protein
MLGFMQECVMLLLLQVALSAPTPGVVSTSSPLNPAGTAAALLDLLAWAPGLEQLLSRQVR